MSNKFYVTTPIYYINDKPHVGHAYSTIAADTLARFYRVQLGEENVKFSTGTDENSKKTIEAAKTAGQDVAAYTNESAENWQNTWQKLGISQTDFIRTTEARHAKTVVTFLEQIKTTSPEHIYEGTYEGLYCYRCEAFYKADELDHGKCPIHKVELELIKEENWFFKLSSYEQKLRDWINGDSKPVRPSSRKNEILAFIDRGLEDISISRAGAEIGIELPFDKTQKVYVWVEALINYLTVAGFPDGDWQDWWNNVHHIVGKDIIKFHGIIWPALCLAAGINPPKLVFAHGFFTINGVKISKSLGNSVDPLDLTHKFGNDALRYYLLREIPFGTDGDFSHERFISVYNADLANDLGNLVARVAAMITKYCEGTYAESQLGPIEIETHIENLELDQALGVIFSQVSAQNKFIEQNKPWELAKNDLEKTKAVLNLLANQIVAIANALEPFLPDTSISIKKIFNAGRVEPSAAILFPKYDDAS